MVQWRRSGRFTLQEACLRPDGVFGPVCALNELAEEAGYLASSGDLLDLGTVYVSKISDTVMHLLAINLDSAKVKKVKASGDGSKGEEGAYCRWVDKEDAVNCDDPILITMVTRLEYANP